MIKKLKVFLIMILVVPFAFMFSACKNGNGNGNGSSGGNGGGGQEQPGGSDDEGGSTDPDNPEVVVENYTIKVEYKFPEKFEFLAEDITVLKQTSETYTLPEIDSKYSEFFDGWYDSSNDEKLTSTTISGTKDETISVYAKWKESDFERYFAFGGITFELDDENLKAIVSGYDETSEIIVIPQLYKSNEKVYSVAGVKANAFASDLTLKEIVTYASQLEIAEGAFENSIVEKFDFLTVSKLGSKAFSGTNVSSVVLPSTFYELGTSVFANCKELESVDFSLVQNEITELSAYTFSGCTKLSSVKLVPTMSVIKAFAFYDCTALENADFVSSDIVTTIENSAFKGAIALNNVVFGKNITTIGNDIFDGCLELKNLSINILPYDGLSSKFSDYYGPLSTVLETLTLTGENITAIYSEYFDGYSALVNLVMNDSLVSVGDYAFAGCENLENITFSTSFDIANFNLSAFKDTKWYKNQTEMLIINNVLISAPSTLSGDVVIPAGVEIISESAFAQNQNITSVTIPASVTTISKYAFQNCSNLESVTFETNSNLTSIALRAFNKCSKLSSINLEVCEKLEKIAGYAFSEIATASGVLILEFKIPAAVESLGNCVFLKSQIAKFVVDSNSVTYASDDYGVIYLIDTSLVKTGIVAYPVGSSESVYVMPNSVSEVKSNAFAVAHNLSYIVVTSENVTYASDSFSNCYYGITILNKTNTLDSGASTYTTVYNYLDANAYSVEVSDTTFEFAFDVTKISSTYYFVEFEYATEKYVYLLQLSVEDDVVTILEATDISEIV